MARLFLAIDLPDAVRQRLTCQMKIPGVRWIPRTNLHVTLHFLGEVADERVPALIERLNEVKSLRFTMEIRDVLFFPDQRKPRILALEVAESFDTFSALDSLHAKTLEVAKRCLNHEPDGRAFRPHVTLARLRDPGPADMRKALSAARWMLRDCPRRMGVNSFVLYESLLRSGGPEYRPVRAFSLQSDPSYLAG